MAGIARGDVEILVHTTAPSRGQDDTRYRALALAYLDFEPAKRQRLAVSPLLTTAEDDLERQVDSQLQYELTQSTPETRESAASYRPDAEGASLTSRGSQTCAKDSLDLDVFSPNLSFNSVLNNADSPVFRKRVTCNRGSPQQECSQAQSSWHTPSSVVEDSQPEAEASKTTFASPTTVLRHYLRNMDNSKLRRTPQPSPESNDSRQPRIRPVQSQESGSLLSTSMIPAISASFNSQPSPSPTRQPEHILTSLDINMPCSPDSSTRSKKKWQLSSSEEVSSSAPPSTVALSTALCAPAPRKRQRAESLPGKGTSSAAFQSSNTSVVPTLTTKSSQFASIWANKLEIRPPPPATSTTILTPEMLLTDSLQLLARKMSIELLYRPVSKVRALRPMERGYWLVDSAQWNDGLQRRFWECLGSYIGKGLGGWGVWSVRGEDFGYVRVYCWGAIVGHVYLVLYMASESKIKWAGATWIGGDGEVVITMES